MEMKKAAGVLPFFDNGTGFNVLLGKEFRERYNSYLWMEFGGKNDKGETLAETACREANEETAGTLGVTLEQILEAESRGEYIDYLNPKTNMFYRMYCVKFPNKIDLENTRREASKPEYVSKENTEMVDWKYFNANDIIFSKEGEIFGSDDDIKIYSTNSYPEYIFVINFSESKNFSRIDSITSSSNFRKVILFFSF